MRSLNSRDIAGCVDLWLFEGKAIIGTYKELINKYEIAESLDAYYVGDCLDKLHKLRLNLDTIEFDLGELLGELSGT